MRVRRAFAPSAMLATTLLLAALLQVLVTGAVVEPRPGPRPNFFGHGRPSPTVTTYARAFSPPAGPGLARVLLSSDRDRKRGILSKVRGVPVSRLAAHWSSGNVLDKRGEPAVAVGVFHRFLGGLRGVSWLPAIEPVVDTRVPVGRFVDHQGDTVERGRRGEVTAGGIEANVNRPTSTEPLGVVRVATHDPRGLDPWRCPVRRSRCSRSSPRNNPSRGQASNSSAARLNDSALDTLVSRGLIERNAHQLLVTTRQFLDYVGLRDLARICRPRP